jgi:hypothetical protein
MAAHCCKDLNLAHSRVCERVENGEVAVGRNRRKVVSQDSGLYRVVSMRKVPAVAGSVCHGQSAAARATSTPAHVDVQSLQRDLDKANQLVVALRCGELVPDLNDREPIPKLSQELGAIDHWNRVLMSKHWSLRLPENLQTIGSLRGLATRMAQIEDTGQTNHLRSCLVDPRENPSHQIPVASDTGGTRAGTFVS